MNMGLTPFTTFLYILGLVLLLVEALFPGFGIAGTSGIIIVIISIVMIAASPFQGFLLLIGTVALIALLIIALVKLGLAKKYLKYFVLNTEQKNEEGYVSNNKYTSYAGKKGIVITPLRPVGTIMIEGGKLEAVSEGEFINKDTAIEVIRIEGSSVFVRETKQH